jgi:hypothetical protein
VVAWKLGTELRLPAGEPIWEFVERGGSYGAPLALFFIRRRMLVNATAPTATAVPKSAANAVSSAAAA